MSREEEQQPLDPDVREALFELQRYLSDSLAPLMVADSVNLLLDYPADLAAVEIQAWTTAQFRSAKTGAGLGLPLSRRARNCTRWGNTTSCRRIRFGATSMT